MRNTILALAGALSLAACSTPGTAPVSSATVTKVLVNSQLFCQIGSAVVAMAQASGSGIAPILAEGASSLFVRAACAAVSGVAVSPPSGAELSPVLVVPSISIPLKA